VREQQSIRAVRYFPHAVAATAVVALLPVAVVWEVRAQRVISSAWLCIGLAIALSFAASLVGSWYWKRRPGGGDLLFSELLIWGWLMRVRVERQLAMATHALVLDTPLDRLPAPRDAATAKRRLELLTQLASAIESHDPYLDGHSHRVARYSAAIAEKLGLPTHEVRRISQAAAVHDVGKLRLPRDVLMKPTALTDDEFEIVKGHSTEGADMVSCLGDPDLTAMVRYHHERLDGSGYPSGLEGEDIPLGARIIAVADTFDAIASPRPYRPAARHEQALAVLESEAGTALDADAVRAFVSYYSGNRLLGVWSALAIVPQHAFAVLRRGGGAPRTAALSPAAATVAVTAVAAAIAPTAIVRAGLARHEVQAPRVRVQSAAAAAPVVAASRPARAHHRSLRHTALIASVARAPSAVGTATAGAPTHATAKTSPRPSDTSAPVARHAPATPPRSPSTRSRPTDPSHSGSTGTTGTSSTANAPTPTTPSPTPSPPPTTTPPPPTPPPPPTTTPPPPTPPPPPPVLPARNPPPPY
jgi:HD domain